MEERLAFSLGLTESFDHTVGTTTKFVHSPYTCGDRCLLVCCPWLPWAEYHHGADMLRFQGCCLCGCCDGCGYTNSITVTKDDRAIGLLRPGSCCDEGHECDTSPCEASPNWLVSKFFVAENGQSLDEDIPPAYTLRRSMGCKERVLRGCPTFSACVVQCVYCWKHCSGFTAQVSYIPIWGPDGSIGPQRGVYAFSHRILPVGCCYAKAPVEFSLTLFETPAGRHAGSGPRTNSAATLATVPLMAHRMPTPTSLFPCCIPCNACGPFEVPTGIECLDSGLSSQTVWLGPEDGASMADAFHAEQLQRRHVAEAIVEERNTALGIAASARASQVPDNVIRQNGKLNPAPGYEWVDPTDNANQAVRKKPEPKHEWRANMRCASFVKLNHGGQSPIRQMGIVTDSVGAQTVRVKFDPGQELVDKATTQDVSAMWLLSEPEHKRSDARFKWPVGTRVASHFESKSGKSTEVETGFVIELASVAERVVVCFDDGVKQALPVSYVISDEASYKKAHPNPTNNHSKTEDSFYELLGLTPDATQKEIRAAYRKMSLELHPDKTSKDKAVQAATTLLFRKIQGSYDCLSDPDKRRLYDKEMGFGVDEAAGNAPKFLKGQKVLIRGLVGKPELNGRRAEIVEWMSQAGRYLVRFEFEGRTQEVAVKETNLRLHTQH